MKFKLLVVFFVICGNYYSQLDSIKKYLKLNVSDSIKVDKAINNIDYMVTDLNQQLSLTDYLEANSPVPKSKKTQAFYLFQKGQIYYDHSKYDEAINYLYKALPLAEETEYFWVQGKIYNYLGIMFSDQGNSKKAVACFIKTYEIAVLRKDIPQQFVSANNVAVDLTALGEYHKAIYYLGKAEAIIRKSKKIKRNYLMSLFGNKLDAYVALKDDVNARKQLDSIFKFFNTFKNNSYEDTISFNHFTGEYYMYKKDYKTALQYLENNIPIIPKHDYHEQMKLYKDLKLCYVNTNNYKKAYDAITNYYTFADSIASSEQLRKSVELEGKYNNIKIENELEISKLTNSNNELKLKRNRIVFVFGTIFTIVLIAGLILFYRLYRDNKRKNLLLTEKNMIIEEKQNEILSSIRYAKRIQESLLPSLKYLTNKISKKNNGIR